jgi:hypothetical protein
MKKKKLLKLLSKMLKNNKSLVKNGEYTKEFSEGVAFAVEFIKWRLKK